MKKDSSESNKENVGKQHNKGVLIMIVITLVLALALVLVVFNTHKVKKQVADNYIVPFNTFIKGVNENDTEIIRSAFFERYWNDHMTPESFIKWTYDTDTNEQIGSYKLVSVKQFDEEELEDLNTHMVIYFYDVEGGANLEDAYKLQCNYIYKSVESSWEFYSVKIDGKWYLYMNKTYGTF